MLFILYLYILLFLIVNSLASSAPLNVTAHNDSSTSILVTWVPPMTRNGMIRSYRVEFTRMNDSNVDDITTDDITTSVIIGMLKKFTTYEVQVFATTVEEGDGSEIITVTTDEDSELCWLTVHVYIIVTKLLSYVCPSEYSSQVFVASFYL